MVKIVIIFIEKKLVIVCYETYNLRTTINLDYLNLNFHPLQAVGHASETQLQVGENYSYLFNLRPNICKFWCLNTLNLDSTGTNFSRQNFCRCQILTTKVNPRNSKSKNISSGHNPITWVFKRIRKG